MKRHLFTWVVIAFISFLLAIYMDYISPLSVWQQMQVMFGMIIVAKLDEIVIRLKGLDE